MAISVEELRRLAADLESDRVERTIGTTDTGKVRSYEATNAPVRINWFSDRIEIQNPGGLFGQVTPENFGRVSDYRNFVLAEAMSVLGYVDKFGTGVARARASLVKNGNPSPDFTFESTHVQVTVRVRS